MLKGNLTCEDISRLILPYIDDKLGQGKRNRVAMHLRNCPFCMEKYRIIKSLFDTIKQKNIQRAKKFQQYRLLSAYCDNEVSKSTRENIEASLALSCELVHRTLKINALKKILNYTIERKFSDFNPGLEKKVMERLKNESFINRIKNGLNSFFSSPGLKSENFLSKV